jgi:hypothetical protein
LEAGVFKNQCIDPGSVNSRECMLLFTHQFVKIGEKEFIACPAQAELFPLAARLAAAAK